MEVDFGGSAPGWVFGQQGYDFLADGRVAAHYPDRTTGETALVVFDEDTVGAPDVPAMVAKSAKVLGTKDGLPHSFAGLAPSPDGSLYLVGGGPDVPSGVYRWDGLVGGEAKKIDADLLACSSSAKIPDGFVSVPKPVEFPSPLGTSFGYYYAPTNPTATSDEEAPPLLVKVHGGEIGYKVHIDAPRCSFLTSTSLYSYHFFFFVLFCCWHRTYGVYFCFIQPRNSILHLARFCRIGCRLRRVDWIWPCLSSALAWQLGYC